MIRNLKALGLALIAAFAMSAVLASSALAVGEDSLRLTPGELPAILTGEQIKGAGHENHRFLTSGGASIECEVAKFAGTIKAGATTLETQTVTIRPTYEKCFGKVGESKLPATVNMTHCDYIFHGGKKAATPVDTFEKGLVDLVCEKATETPHVELYMNELDHTNKKALCSLTVTPFVNKGNNTFTNTTGTPDDVDVTSKVEGIAVDRTGSLLCGAKEQTATYTGTTTLRAFKDQGVHLISSEPTIYEYTDTGQINLTVSE